MIDIDLDHKFDEISMRIWPVKIFLFLQRDHALSLIERPLPIYKKIIISRVKSDSSIFPQKESLDSSFGNPEVFTHISTTRGRDECGSSNSSDHRSSEGKISKI